jgi:hypothetical protein
MTGTVLLVRAQENSPIHADNMDQKIIFTSNSRLYQASFITINHCPGWLSEGIEGYL